MKPKPPFTEWQFIRTHCSSLSLWDSYLSLWATRCCPLCGPLHSIFCISGMAPQLSRPEWWSMPKHLAVHPVMDVSHWHTKNVTAHQSNSSSECASTIKVACCHCQPTRKLFLSSSCDDNDDDDGFDGRLLLTLQIQFRVQLKPADCSKTYILFF